MQLDVFAALLRVLPGELLHAARTDGILEDLVLPVRRQVRVAALMFDQDEATAFARQWNTRTLPVQAGSGAPLISLDAFAAQAGVAPLALLQAVSSGKTLRGITPPVAVKEGRQLMFDPADVARFIQARNQAMKSS